jgi:PAS domain S-box-containing protein
MLRCAEAVARKWQLLHGLDFRRMLLFAGVGANAAKEKFRTTIGIKAIKFPSARSIERLPGLVRALLGCCAASLAVILSDAIGPLRIFPLLLGLPTVILSFWFLDWWGGVVSALTSAVLVEVFMTTSQTKILLGNPGQEIRMPLFLVVSITLGWAIRRLAEQRAELGNQELQRQLLLADSERLLAEERARASEALRDRDALLQIALEANGMGLWVWDLEHDLVHWSDEMFRMAGHEPGSIEPTFDGWAQFMHPDDVSCVREARKQACENGKDYHQQYRVRWKDGSVRWLESQGKCQRDSEGRVTRVVGVLADVTHRQHAEEAMLRAEKLAVAGRLAASVAHEINNPLEAVANLLFLITLTETQQDAREHARSALDQLMRVSLITQQTLKFHRQSGSPTMTKLSEVVENVLALFRGRLAANVIAAEVKAEGEIEVACMPSEAQQIFANLVANAIEAMPRGGHLAVRVRPSRDWRDRNILGMRVTFADSGMGVDRATMRRMFEPFFTTKIETGTGLGLWVVAQLIDRHHGHVRVWSRQCGDSSGTAFSVFLPLQEAPEDAPADNPALQVPALQIPAM